MNLVHQVTSCLLGLGSRFETAVARRLSENSAVTDAL